MVKVCDAIMGSGKSSSAIRYMNEHKDEKFIYITPYLEEASRIRDGCPALHFAEPSSKIPEFKFKKYLHTAHLIHQGRNIATTHQAFKFYTQDMLDEIKQLGYTLIIDETVDVLECCEFSSDDIQIAIKAGYIRDDGENLSISDEQTYSGGALRPLFDMLNHRGLIRIRNDKKEGSSETLYYWILPPDLITSFKDVYVLTYMFRGQSLHHLMEIHDIPYKYIGVERTEDGGYRFGAYQGYTPKYVSNLESMLNIIDDDKLNAIGDTKTALSMSWFQKNIDGVDRLRKNIYNIFNNVWRRAPQRKKMWGTYKGSYHGVKGAGYTKTFLSFNTKATNDYRDKEYLVYASNIFMNVGEKLFYQKHGVDVDEDAYALSIMIQWIWRSAIRDGKSVNIYIPSKRMRTLLQDWIMETSSALSAA